MQLETFLKQKSDELYLDTVNKVCGLSLNGKIKVIENLIDELCSYHDILVKSLPKKSKHDEIQEAISKLSDFIKENFPNSEITILRP